MTNHNEEIYKEIRRSLQTNGEWHGSVKGHAIEIKYEDFGYLATAYVTVDGKERGPFGYFEETVDALDALEDGGQCLNQQERNSQ